MINDKLIIISVLAFYQVKTWVQGSSVAVVPDRQGRAGCDAQRHQVAQALDDPILCALAPAGVVTLHVPQIFACIAKTWANRMSSNDIFISPIFGDVIYKNWSLYQGSGVIQGHPGSSRVHGRVHWQVSMWCDFLVFRLMLLHG